MLIDILMNEHRININWHIINYFTHLYWAVILPSADVKFILKYKYF